jgi:hypothetical protein
VFITGIRLQDVQQVFTSLLEHINKLGLEINEKRQKFVIVSRKPYSGIEYVKTVTRNFEIVKDYTYLSKILKNKNELRPEIEKKNYKCKYSEQKK